MGTKTSRVFVSHTSDMAAFPADRSFVQAVLDAAARAGDGAHPIALDLLTDNEARQLLTRRLGANRVAAESAAVEEIIIRCAHLPLALAMVAAHAAVRPQVGLRLLANELRDTQHRWQTLTGDDPTMNVQAVFSWSYQALTPDAARLFRQLGLHPGPDIATAAAASLAGVPATTVRLRLAELTRASLLVEATPDRYTFHDLLRAYATDLAHTTDLNQLCEAAIHRVLDHYLHSAYTADRLLHPTRDPIVLTAPQPGVTPEHPTDYRQALDWFTMEHPVLLAAIDHAAATGFDIHAWQLARTLRIFLDRRGHWYDQAATSRVAVTATHRLADLPERARAHRNLAHAYIRLGCFDDAYTQLTHALDLTIQAGDRAGQAHTHYNLAYLWGWRVDYPQALDHIRQALSLYQATGHLPGQANALNRLGWYHALHGSHRQALIYCQQALALNQELDDRDGQAHTWDSLGYAHHHLGHHDQALACYKHALDLFQDLGDRYEEADTLIRLGETRFATGNPQAAHYVWRQALTILDDLSHPTADELRTKLDTLDAEPNEPGR